MLGNHNLLLVLKNEKYKIIVYNSQKGSERIKKCKDKVCESVELRKHTKKFIRFDIFV